MGPEARGLLGYLVSSGVADAETMRAGDTSVIDLSRTHAVSLVTLPDGRRLVVKRARPRPGELVGNLEREVAAYALAGRCRELAAAMPECLFVDPARQVLVLRAVEPGETLHASAHSGSGPSPEHARRLGGLIAGWQRATPAPLPSLPRDEPWVLGILEPGRWRPAIADALLVHGVVRRELRARFADLRERIVLSCLAHGDLKWDNCLGEGDGGVRVVDWESAAVGDPAWDVAGIVHEHSVVCRATALARGSARSGQAQASLDAFLDAYRGAAPPDADAVLARALPLSGARLVQTSLEWAAAGMDGGAARALLDDGLAALREPERMLVPTAS